VGWKRFLTAGALGAALCLAWFVPLMISSDGLSNYMRVMGEFSRRFQSTTSVFMGAGWWGVGYNVRKLAMYTLYGWNVVLAPGAIYAAARLWRREWPTSWEKLVYLCLWIAPSLLFYTIVHMGQQGLIFVFLPALLLVGAVGLTRLLATRPRWLIGTAALLIVLNAGVFCLAPEYPLGPNSQRLLTRATLVNSDRYYQDRFQAIEDNFAPASTAILAAHWHHVEYYLPEYKKLPFEVGTEQEKDEGQPRGNPNPTVATPAELGLQPDSQSRAIIVVFDPYLMAFSESPTPARELPLKHGESLQYFELSEGQTFHYGSQSFGIAGN